MVLLLKWSVKHLGGIVVKPGLILSMSALNCNISTYVKCKKLRVAI